MKINDSKRIKSFLPYLLILIVAFLILWPQIKSQAFVSGLDYYFHMSRTYETAMQIKTGHFSYFLSLFSWGHNARIVNALYGPIGGYVSGLILLIVKSWYHWELVMSFLALAISGTTMYYLGNYWHLKVPVNFLISVLYMLSSPLNDFVFKQTFAGFGAAFVPLIVLMASEALFEKDINPLKLALILVLIIEIHLMTFLLSLIFLGVCLIISCLTAQRTRKLLISHVAEAAGLTIVLSFNIWGSILEVFGSNYHHIIPTKPGTDMGVQNYNTIMNTYPKTAFLQTPSVIGLGIAILIVVTIIMWIVNLRRVSYTLDLLMIFGIAFVWLSSEWFPWSWINQHASYIITLIQFPKRFLPLGLALIYLLMGALLTKFVKTSSWPKLAESLSVIMLCLVTGWCLKSHNDYLRYKINLYHGPAVMDMVGMHRLTHFSPQSLRHSLHSTDLSQIFTQLEKSTPDYMPTGTKYLNGRQYQALNPYYLYSKVYQGHLLHWKIPRLGQETVTIKSSHREYRIVPIAKYSHTQVQLNHHWVHPTINQVGAMRLHLKTGYNQLSVHYQPARWFEAGVIISLLAWVLVIIVSIMSETFYYRKVRLVKRSQRES